jgi:hypothetical protein
MSADIRTLLKRFVSAFEKIASQILRRKQIGIFVPILEAARK